MNEDILPELRRSRVQQLARIDRLIPWLDLTTLDSLFLFEAQFGELFAQDIDVLAKLPRQCRQPTLMLNIRQLDDGRERLLLLAILALGFFSGLTLLTLSFFSGLAFLTFLPGLTLTLNRGPLFLCATLDSPPLGLLVVLLLLVLLDDGFDHALERDTVDT